MSVHCVCGYGCIVMCVLQDDPTLITDIRGDIQEECSKFGTVKKILMFDVCMCRDMLKR